VRHLHQAEHASPRQCCCWASLQLRWPGHEQQAHLDERRALENLVLLKEQKCLRLDLSNCFLSMSNCEWLSIRDWEIGSIVTEHWTFDTWCRLTVDKRKKTYLPTGALVFVHCVTKFIWNRIIRCSGRILHNTADEYFYFLLKKYFYRPLLFYFYLSKIFILYFLLLLK